MATAKQRAWRAKFARLYGGGRKRKRKLHGNAYVGYLIKRKANQARRVYSMARRRYGRRRRGGGGMNSLLKAGLYGVAASMVLPRFVSVDSKIAGAAGGYFASKSILGAAVGYFAPTLLGGVLGGSTSNSW